MPLGVWDFLTEKPRRGRGGGRDDNGYDQTVLEKTQWKSSTQRASQPAEFYTVFNLLLAHTLGGWTLFKRTEAVGNSGQN